MQEITRKQLNDATAMIKEENDELQVSDSYSGRGMYGIKCIGIVGDTVADAIKFMIALAEQLSPEDPEDQKVIISEMATAMRHDGMGRHQMIYYFPDWVVDDKPQGPNPNDPAYSLKARHTRP